MVTALIQTGFSGPRMNPLPAKMHLFPGCETPQFLAR